MALGEALVAKPFDALGSVVVLVVAWAEWNNLLMGTAYSSAVNGCGNVMNTYRLGPAIWNDTGH